MSGVSSTRRVEPGNIPVGRLVRSADFERVLRTRTQVNSAHFAVHHVADRPSRPSKPAKTVAAGELSTGGAPVVIVPVDDSSPTLVSAAEPAGSDSALSTAVQAATVPASPGPYTITVANAATFSVDVGVAYASGAPLVAVASAPAHGQYSVAAGVYTFNAADAGASVTITYGQTKIPDDVVDAALRLVTMRFKQKGRDPMLMSQSQPNLGDKRWWVGSVPGQNGALPPEIKGLLEGAYRVPVVG